MAPIIDQFWKQVIEGYYKHDILELEGIVPKSNQYGKCAVGQFLTVASALELVAKLVRDGEEFKTDESQSA